MRNGNLDERTMAKEREFLVILVVLPPLEPLLRLKTGMPECVKPKEPVTQNETAEETKELGNIETITTHSITRAIHSHAKHPLIPGMFHGCHIERCFPLRKGLLLDLYLFRRDCRAISRASVISILDPAIASGLA
jgi:hypothetical protein